MDNRTTREDGDGAMLSALCDGEVEAAEAAAGCAAWRADAALRRDWHAWHVAGDVLRSEELAIGANTDAQFLAALRERLQSEPVVLAPAPLPESTFAVRRRRSRWALSGAVAAGFVLVAGTIVVMRPGGIEGPPPVEIATLGPDVTVPAIAPVVAVSETVTSTTAPARVQLIRDARLDRYLAAHRQFAGSTAPGWSQATLRNATVQVEGR